MRPVPLVVARVVMAALGALAGGPCACRGPTSTRAPPPVSAGVVTSEPPAARLDPDAGALRPVLPAQGLSGPPLVEASDEALCVVTGNVMRRWGMSLRGPNHPGVERTTFPAPATRLACGKTHACVVTDAGEIWCLGYSRFGDLGVITGEMCPGLRPSPCSTTPVKVPGLPKMVDVALNANDNCAVSAAGEVYCWGEYAWSWLGGTGARPDAGPPRPEEVFRVPALTDVRRVAVGADLACALDGRGDLACWGRNLYGDLGRGTHADVKLPPAPVPGLHGVTAMALGDHACVLAEGAVRCWGVNSLFAVDDRTEPRCDFDHLPCAPSPRRVALPTSAKIVDLPSLGVSSCVLDADGAVYCWGGNRHEALGPGGEACIAQPCVRRPRKLLGLPPFTRILGSSAFLCGITAGRELLCWGDLDGELHVRATEPAQCKDCAGPIFRVAI